MVPVFVEQLQHLLLMERVETDGLPEIEITRAELEAGVYLVDALVMAGFAKSKSEARRLISQGAVRLSKYGRPSLDSPDPDQSTDGESQGSSRNYLCSDAP